MARKAAKRWAQAMVPAIATLGIGFGRPIAARSKTELKGRIAAYRPADRLQAAPSVVHQELFLFRTEDGKVLKLVYRHPGTSGLKGKALSGAQEIAVSVRRDGSCDQTLSAFVKEAPAVRLRGALPGSATERVVFNGLAPHPPEGYRMECYVLESWKQANAGKPAGAR